MLIRECAAEDVASLEDSMPSHGAGVHASHFVRQESGSATYLVAWVDDVPIGVGVISWDGWRSPEARASLPECVEIAHLQVHPDSQGQGVGTALIGRAEELIAARGRGVAGLGVGVDNVRAATLYARLGYVDSGVRAVSRYTYRGADGVDRRAEERDAYLTKVLS